MSEFNNHYWLRRDGRIFNLQSKTYVTKDDKEYQAWLADGGVPKFLPKDEQGKEIEDVQVHRSSLGVSERPPMDDRIAEAVRIGVLTPEIRAMPDGGRSLFDKKTWDKLTDFRNLRPDGAKSRR